jgi:hypothetical protein
MTSHRKKPGVAFWATVVVVVVLVLYPLSFVPACWVSSRVQPNGVYVSAVYRPIIVAWHNSPPYVQVVVTRSILFGIRGSSLGYRGYDFYTIEFPEFP